MSETTKIEWAQHTGGPFLGCSIVSPGCALCYAKALAEGRLAHIFRNAYKAAGFEDWATRPIWGDKATRVLSKGFWHDARNINARHAKAGTRGRWFPSMIDWLDKMPGGIISQEGAKVDPAELMANFLTLIDETRSLDWLLLTKRPENFFELVREAVPQSQAAFAMRTAWLSGYPPLNVWIGASVEDQPRVSRIKDLLKIPAPIHFLSVEPLISEVQLGLNAVNYQRNVNGRTKGDSAIDWVIVGGESGPKCRPCHIEWIYSVVDQCMKSGTPVFVKQLGGNPTRDTNLIHEPMSLNDEKGGNMEEWPADLRIRQYPSL